jgi:hypothetical protein
LVQLRTLAPTARRLVPIVDEDAAAGTEGVGLVGQSYRAHCSYDDELLYLPPGVLVSSRESHGVSHPYLGQQFFVLVVPLLSG